MPHLTLLRRAAAAGIIMACATGVTLAQDATDFVDKLKQAYSSVGYDITFGPASADGDTITIGGMSVTVTSPDGDEENGFETDSDLVFFGVTEWDDGSYTADSLTIEDTEYTEDDLTVSLANIEAHDIYVPASASEGAIATLQGMGELSAGPLTVVYQGHEVFSIAGLNALSTFSPEQGSEDLTEINGSFTAQGIKLDLSWIEDSEARAGIDALGLTTITGHVEQAFDWTMSDGRINVSASALSLDNIGTLDLTFDISGYTPAVLDELYAEQARISDMTGTAAEISAAEEAMGLQVLKNLSFLGLSLRFDDASITNRILDYLAAEQGIKRADFVSGLKMIAPMMAAQAGQSPVIRQAIDAVGKFLDNPQSLQLTAAPASPLTFSDLAAASVEPDTLLDLLGLSIVANQPR